MTGVIGLYLYTVTSECLTLDLSDQAVAKFIYNVAKSTGAPWRTLPKRQVTSSKGRTLLHWEAEAAEAPAFGVYHSGNLSVHIKPKSFLKLSQRGKGERADPYPKQVARGPSPGARRDLQHQSQALPLQ